MSSENKYSLVIFSNFDSRVPNYQSKLHSLKKFYNIILIPQDTLPSIEEMKKILIFLCLIFAVCAFPLGTEKCAISPRVKAYTLDDCAALAKKMTDCYASEVKFDLKNGFIMESEAKEKLLILQQSTKLWMQSCIRKLPTSGGFM
mgnify:FL=1